MNNLDPDVAERPDDLVVYGGTGRAARSWDAFDAIVAALRALETDETLLVQSGKPVAVFRTHADAPRVLIANANLVGRWATWDDFRELERAGLMMYGQMTAGSWIYIGSQGILQGTYETFGAMARRHFGGSLAGRFVLTAGLGGMGGAQPLAATMNGAAILGVEVDEARIDNASRPATAIARRTAWTRRSRWIDEATAGRAALSVGLVGNGADVLPELVRRGVVPDVLTDQTSAHDTLNGYVPAGIRSPRRPRCASAIPGATCSAPTASIADARARHAGRCSSAGAVTFDYGNNIRTVAFDAGVANAFDIPGLRSGVHPAAVLRGEGPVPLGRALRRPGGHSPHRRPGPRALPARRAPAALDHAGARARALPGAAGAHLLAGAGRARAVRRGAQRPGGARRTLGARSSSAATTSTPASVASPFRETEAMKDGSDAIADWPILNAMLNVASGASWVSFHHGGGVGIGNSLHAGQVIVADGTPEMRVRLERVLTNDPGHRRRAPRRRGLRDRRWRRRSGSTSSCPCGRPADEGARSAVGRRQSLRTAGCRLRTL